MKTTLKVLAWVQVILGGLGIIGLMSEDGNNSAGIVVGFLIIATGAVALNYISEVNKTLVASKN